MNFIIFGIIGIILLIPICYSIKYCIEMKKEARRISRRPSLESLNSYTTYSFKILKKVLPESEKYNPTIRRLSLEIPKKNNDLRRTNSFEI